MDEGLPIAYSVLEAGVPVLASGGEQVGTVHHVVAAAEQDIFHGLVIAVRPHELRFVAAEEVASLHEHGVDLRIDEEAVGALPVPGGGAPTFTEDPAETKWAHWAKKAALKGDWRRER
jgi:hypothetical protein